MFGEGLSMARIGAFPAWFIRVAVLVGIGPIDVTPWVIAGVLAGMAPLFVMALPRLIPMFAKDIPALGNGHW